MTVKLILASKVYRRVSFSFMNCDCRTSRDYCFFVFWFIDFATEDNTIVFSFVQSMY